MKAQKYSVFPSLLLVSLLSTISLIVIIPTSYEVSAYTPHDPIYISGNADFTSANGVTGGSGTPSDPYIIDGWEINASAANGMEIRNTDAHFIIRNVYVYGGLGINHGIFIYDGANGRVENATVSNNLIGILFDSSANATISGNNVSSNNGNGIFLVSSANATISGNNVSSNNGSGIYLRSSSNVTITGNSVSSNNGNGIYLWSSSNVTITGNDVFSNDWDGVFLSSCADAIISGNNLSNNGFGISLVSSANATISGNNLSNNGFGISLVSSGNIRVHHNNLVNNMVQAYDDGGSQNAWDDGYPSGGNYWSDYTGIDQFSGPLQDQTGSDGIGDTPHIIDLDSLDRYPLMSPVGTVFPRPPTSLRATLSGRDLENVTITWSLSEDDGAGLKSVVGYEIYKNTTYNPKGVGYGLVASLPNGTMSFSDTYAGEGDPSIYFYQVCAVDLTNNTTCAQNQAAKFTHPLAQGPNLVSIPLIQSNESIEHVLQTVKFDKAWHYDSLSGKWKWFMTSKNYRRGLWNINHTMGLWVNVTEDSNLTVVGIVPSQTTIYLHKGWNLVGFPSFNAFSVGDLKATVPVDKVEGFQTVPPHFLKVVSDSDVLLAGQGYWVRVETDTVWKIDII